MGVGFRELYYDSLVKELRKIDEKKIQLENYDNLLDKKRLIYTILFLLSIVVLSFIHIIFFVTLFFSFPLVILLLSQIWEWKDKNYNKIFNEYQSMVNNYKFSTIQKIANDINETIIINSMERVSMKEIKQLELFKEKVGSYEFGAVFTGKTDKVEFKFFNSKFVYKKENVEQNIFSGIIFIADFNKDIKNLVKILPKNKYSVIERFESGITDYFEKKIKIDNTKFEKYFDLFGSDEIEIRYILSPLLIEKIANIGEKFSGTSYFAFNDGKIYIGIPSRINFDDEILKIERMQENYELISFVANLVDELDLNTRIWTKE